MFVCCYICKLCDIIYYDHFQRFMSFSQEQQIKISLLWIIVSFIADLQSLSDKYVGKLHLNKKKTPLTQLIRS